MSKSIEANITLKHDESLSAYFRCDYALYLIYWDKLYKDRIVVPVSLRSRVLNVLYLPHYGITSMLNRYNQVDCLVAWYNPRYRVKSQRYGPNSPYNPSLLL